MNRHLDEVEITTVIAGLELEAPAAEHLDGCVACRRQVQATTELIALRKEQVNSGMPNWEEQQLQILASLPEQKVVRLHSRLRLMLAAAAALVLAVGLGILRHGDVQEPPRVAEVSVEQILAEADALLADESIPGFDLIDPGLQELLEDHGQNGAS